jgi:hypothetical protein
LATALVTGSPPSPFDFEDSILTRRGHDAESFSRRRKGE